MLSAVNRLAKDSDIEAVFKRGQTFYSGNLGLRQARNQLAVSRVAIVVSLKVSKKAVERNLLKRRLREIIRREIVPGLKTGFDIVVMTKKTLLELPFADLKKLTIGLFQKARLL